MQIDSREIFLKQLWNFDGSEIEKLKKCKHHNELI